MANKDEQFTYEELTAKCRKQEEYIKELEEKLKPMEEFNFDLEDCLVYLIRKKFIVMRMKPKEAIKVLKGEKTIEIRRNKPDCQLPTLCYIYCKADRKKCLMVSTKDQEKTYLKPIKRECSGDGFFYDPREFYVGNGCVVAKFTVKKIEKLTNGYAWFIENLKVYDKARCL